MIAQQQRILNIVYRAIEDVNRELPADKKLEKAETTELYSESSALDSLGLVKLILTTEEYLEDEFGVLVTISDQVVTSRAHNPFKTVQTFAEFIEDQLAKGA